LLSQQFPVLVMEYGSVIFDMDGVLLNSLVSDEKWKYDAVRDALRGKDLDVDNVSKNDLRCFLGDYGREECIDVCEEYGLDPGEVWELIAESTNLARVEKLKEGDFRLYSDARGFLESLNLRDTELGIISNAPEDAVKSTLKVFNVEKYFEYYRGVEDFQDLRKRKPHPDHIEIAEAELKRKPFLYIGDQASDIEAANNAGIDSAWIKRGSNEDIDATYKVEDLEELGEKLGILG